MHPIIKNKGFIEQLTSSCCFRIDLSLQNMQPKNINQKRIENYQALKSRQE